MIAWAMIAWARLPKGTVYHAFDVKYPYAKFYRSVCGMWREEWKLFPGDLEKERRCKGCQTEMGRHLKRSAPT
jgi:hypothetical protein